MLYRIQQSDAGHVIAQDSLLWGQEGKKSKPRWGKAFWEKIIGELQKDAAFLGVLAGEKCQAIGFLWGMVCRRKAAESAARRVTARRAAKEAGAKT